MKSYEFINETKKKQTVYHGTAESFLPSIMKTGLGPHINKYEKMWANKYGYKYDFTSAQNNKALFVSTKIEDAILFGGSSTHKERKFVVLAFELLPSDLLGEKQTGFVTNEILILNTIKPDRLRVVYPKNYSLNKVIAKSDATKSKTIIIRQINKLLNNPKWKVASGSNKSDLIHIKNKLDNMRVHSIKLSDLADWLATKPTVEDWFRDKNNNWQETTSTIIIKPTILKQIQKIIS